MFDRLIICMVKKIALNVVSIYWMFFVCILVFGLCKSDVIFLIERFRLLGEIDIS